MNWERLVEVVLRKENERILTLADSRASSFSSISSSFRFGPDSPFHEQNPQLEAYTVNLLEDKMSKWIPARKLYICWIKDPRYWAWTHHPPDRRRLSLFPMKSTEVAELRMVCFLDIMGTIDVKSLRKYTNYGAYLVFKLKKGSSGLEQAKAEVKFVEDRVDYSLMKNEAGATVSLVDKKEVKAYEHVPHLRKDGWNEIKLGQFLILNEWGDEGKVHMRLFETEKLHWKYGLLVKGIEVRPI